MNNLFQLSKQACDDKGYIAHFDDAKSPESHRLIGTTPEPPTLIPEGSFVMPAFCDLHLHAPQFLYQGTGLHLPLMQWLDEYAFKAEERLDSDPVLARKVYTRLADRLVENGTGTVLLFGTIKEDTNLILAETMKQVGIRAYVGKVSMDISSRPSYVEQSAEIAIASARSFAQRCRQMVSGLPPHRRLVEPVLTPRFVPTCSDDLLSGLAVLSQEMSLRVQSHLAEAHDEIDWVKRLRGTNDLDIFDRCSLLTSRTIQAHCTFMSKNELERLAERGTSIAHCPLSNAYFSAEPFHLHEALQVGIDVGLGSDIAGGYSLDIMSAARTAVAVSRMREGRRLLNPQPSGVETKDTGENLGIDWKEALYLATRGGIRALGLDEAGSFSVGSPFDAQQIQLFNSSTKKGIAGLDFFDLEGTCDSKDDIEIDTQMLEKWWCLGTSENRVCIWVQGRLLTSPLVKK